MIITIFHLFVEKTGAVKALHHLLHLLTSAQQGKLFTAQDSEADLGLENTIRWVTMKISWHLCFFIASSCNLHKKKRPQLFVSIYLIFYFLLFVLE